MSKAYFNLSAGGAEILQAASRIYAAYVRSGRVPEGKEKEWMRRSLKHAMSFAKTIDDLDDSATSPVVTAAGGAIAAAVTAKPTDSADPDDTAYPNDSTDTLEAVDAQMTGDRDDGQSSDDTGIELSVTTDERTMNDDDALDAIMDDQPEPPGHSVAADPTAEMMDELPDADQDMSLDADDDFPVPPKPTATNDDIPVATKSAADDDELDIDENVLAAFADTDLGADDKPSKPVAKQATTPAATNESDEADESGEAIEFLSTLADELPPSTDDPADMDDIMSALMDDAADPVPLKPAGAENPAGAAKSESPIEIDDVDDSIPIAEHDGDGDAEIDAVVVEDQDEQPESKTTVKPDRPQYARLDEPTNPTEADLATTHLPDDLSFELVDEDIDMNKLIEDAITATEKKDDANR